MTRLLAEVTATDVAPFERRAFEPRYEERRKDALCRHPPSHRPVDFRRDTHRVRGPNPVAGSGETRRAVPGRAAHATCERAVHALIWAARSPEVHTSGL